MNEIENENFHVGSVHLIWLGQLSAIVTSGQAYFLSVIIMKEIVVDATCIQPRVSMTLLTLLLTIG